MPLPRGPQFPTFSGVRPPPTAKAAPVLGVGSRALVVSGNGRSHAVTLTDDAGTQALATIADGAEVEILAWRPRRGGETRYRVVSTSGGTEGWLGAGSLQARPAPPPPPQPVGAAPGSSARPAPVVGPRKRSPAGARVAPKPMNRSPKNRTTRGSR